MFDRGDELAEQAWNDLLQFPTRTTARAMAVVLTEGLRDAELRRRDDRALPRASLSAEYPSPEAFLPQRERIKQKLRSPKGIAALLVSAARPGRWPRFFNQR